MHHTPTIKRKRFMMNKLMVTLVLACSSIFVLGQTEEPAAWRNVFTDLQLQKLIETAVEHTADLRNANLNVEQADATLRLARLAMLPSLNVGVEHWEGVNNRNSAVCYKLYPDYTGVTRYPLGTAVEVWYCDATEADIERIISNFKVDSSQIFHTQYDGYDDYYITEEDETLDEGWDW